tara:strand:- start:61 stop:633 length:573 start_codon:yes stop_codon:yes gene_type:complete
MKKFSLFFLIFAIFLLYVFLYPFFTTVFFAFDRTQDYTCGQNDIFIKKVQISRFKNKFNYLRDQGGEKEIQIKIINFDYMRTDLGYETLYEVNHSSAIFPIDYDYNYRVSKDCYDKGKNCTYYDLDRISLELRVPSRRDGIFMQCKVFQGTHEEFDKLIENANDRAQESKERYQKDKERIKTEKRKERQI